jgi:replicative DNA helicase
MHRHEDLTGVKTKLLIIDYLECLAGPYTDSTANTGYISNQMKDLATELGVCSVMLLQTQKHGGDISDPITSMKRIKGSSVIEQSASVVLTLWREGYDPMTVQQDRFMSFAAVKNRFGPLWQDDFYFRGSSGMIWDIDEAGRDDIEELRKEKAAAKLLQAQEQF